MFGFIGFFFSICGVGAAFSFAKVGPGLFSLVWLANPAPPVVAWSSSSLVPWSNGPLVLPQPKALNPKP